MGFGSWNSNIWKVPGQKIILFIALLRIMCCKECLMTLWSGNSLVAQWNWTFCLSLQQIPLPISFSHCSDLPKMKYYKYRAGTEIQFFSFLPLWYTYFYLVIPANKFGDWQISSGSQVGSLFVGNSQRMPFIPSNWKLFLYVPNKFSGQSSRESFDLRF